jgi:hypothetical protein
MVMCAAALFVVGETQAQSPAPNPLDAMPDVMPFDVPYGPPIALERVKAVIAVVDSGGNLIAFERMGGAQLGAIAVSEPKAREAVPAAWRTSDVNR